MSQTVTLSDFVTFLSAFLSIISVVLAYFGIKYAIKSTNKLKEELQEDLSTNYIGKFPDHLPEIIKQLKSAQKSVKILVDSPMYGCFSEPKLAASYASELSSIKMEKSIKLKMVVPNPVEQNTKDIEQIRPLVTGQSEVLKRCCG